MKLISLMLLLLSLAACNRGWTQADRDKLTSSCVEKALAGASGMEPDKVKNYCSCYQQSLEKTYPSITALAKATPESLSQEAQKCLPIIIKQ